MLGSKEIENNSKAKLIKPTTEKENLNNSFNRIEKEDEENNKIIFNTKNYKKKDKINSLNSIITVNKINNGLIENFLFFNELENEVSKSFILDLLMCLNKDNHESDEKLLHFYTYLKGSHREYSDYNSNLLENKLKVVVQLINKDKLEDAYNCLNSDSVSLHSNESETYKKLISQKKLLLSKILFKMNFIKVTEDGNFIFI